MKHRIISKREDIDEIIKRCEFCNLSMVDENNSPYVIPMNFGYNQGIVYLHSSRQGKKINILQKNNQVCLSFSTDHELRWQSEQVACSYSMKYRSVLLQGHVEFIDEFDNKVEALKIIMNHYTERKFAFNKPAVSEVAVYKVIPGMVEGRVYGY